MSTALVRSPQALAPLVEEQVSLGYEAGYKFYVAAGHLLLEARETIKSDAKWGQYVKARGISPRQSQEWMRSAEGEKRGLGHKTVRGSRTDPRTSRVTHRVTEPRLGDALHQPADVPDSGIVQETAPRCRG